MSATTSLKIDPTLKRDAQTLFESLGLNLTTAVNLFLRQAVREQAIPFRIGNPEPQMFYTQEDFYRKLEKGLAEVKAGYGVEKTLDELRAIETSVDLENNGK